MARRNIESARVRRERLLRLIEDHPRSFAEIDELGIHPTENTIRADLRALMDTGAIRLHRWPGMRNVYSTKDQVPVEPSWDWGGR